MSTKNQSTINNHGGTVRIGVLQVGDSGQGMGQPRAPSMAQEGLHQRPRLRQRIHEVLRSDVDLDAFCLDYFPGIYKRMSQGMERGSKVNLLLEHAEPQLLEQRLAEWING